MRIALHAAAKTFGRETVFRDLSIELLPGSRTAVLGPNGSGKSTLLQCLAGALTLTNGRIEHELGGERLDAAVVYRHVSIAVPYLDLYDELDLAEALRIHARFKPFAGHTGARHIAASALLEEHLNKPVRNFSSGMKQRLKLTLALLSDTPLVLLDEPTSNLDAPGIVWFQTLLAEHVRERTLVVASNRQNEETALCTSSIDLAGWK